MATRTSIFRSARKVVLRALYASNGGVNANEDTKLAAEQDFICAVRRERKRCERCNSSLLLLLLDTTKCPEMMRDALLQQIAEGWWDGIRETDLLGWYRESRVIGVVFTDVSTNERSAAVKALRSRADSVLLRKVKKSNRRYISSSLYIFPEENDGGEQPRNGAHPLYRDLSIPDVAGRISLALKRGIDILGSASGLLLLAPLLFLIAIAIKLSSPGTILFRQQRLGQHGVSFAFLKFRSMYANTDSSLHREYISRLIGGEIHPAVGKPIYKITSDPRVTPVGRWLRKTSLDELPQLWNVLKGEMSLVGPRPPILYEVEKYNLWHKARVLEVKPGITGLWQVAGRSRLRFDDMVRLDLRYARKWSLWLDLKILAKTPLAVVSGDGAY